MADEIIEPKFKLPEEIEKMSPAETECKYCGISYLIHSEVTRLKKKLQDYETMVEEYKVSGDQRRYMRNISAFYRKMKNFVIR
jgi:hypothetical protein